MRYRRIANTEIDVSEIGFGVWTLASGWWGERSDAEAITLLRQAFDRGVTFFDTADTYGDGRGERLLAQAFPGADRAEIVIGTKCGYDWESRSEARRAGQREAPQRFDVPFLERALAASLERLGCEHIDLWQLHNVRMAQLDDDALWTFLERVQHEGRVRAVGVALGPAIGWREEGEYALRERPGATVQMIYNALELDPGRALIQAARAHGRSLLVRVPHASGMLEGRYTADTTFAEGDHRRHRPERWLREGLQKVEQLRFLTDGTGRTLGQAALRFVLHEPCVASVLPNVYELAQLDEFVGASDCPDLSADDVVRVAELYERNYGLPREAAEAATS
ncbi:MAG: aldo/keto reductase [Dehalococcoidia bacterium]|nr:aldo/keto reductase [Dehalococcoidia bacterium]